MTVRLVLVLVACARIASAQPDLPPPPPHVDHFHLGVTLFKEGNYAAALAEFETSYKLQPNPGILYNIGLAHQRLFHVAEALDALRRFVDDPAAPADKRATAVAIIADLGKLLAPVEFRITPAGAQLTIGDRPVGVAPLAGPIQLAAGRHRITVEAEGHRAVRREIIVAAGVAEMHEIALEAIAKTGRVRLSAPVRGATVAVDDRPRAAVPLELDLPAGHHTFDFAARGHAGHRMHLDVAAGSIHEVVGRLAARPARRWYKQWYVWVPIGVVALGTTALVIGGDGFIDGTLGGKRL